MLQHLQWVNNAVLLLGVLSAAVFRLDAAVAELPRPGHWPTHRRQVVVVDRTADRGWQQATRWAVDRWNEVGAGVRLRWSGGAGDCAPDDGSITVCTRSRLALTRQGNPGMEGLTTPILEEGRHTRAVRVLVCADCRLDAARRRVVATHELGHALGLAHNPSVRSVMYRAGGSEVPDAADARALRAMYAHHDAPSRCGVLHLRLGPVCL